MKGVSYFSNFVRKLIVNDYNTENLSILEDRDDKSLIHLTHEKNYKKIQPIKITIGNM